jgi:hypothetical protein
LIIRGIHHLSRSFKEELFELLNKHGIDLEEKYLDWEVQPLCGCNATTQYAPETSGAIHVQGFPP